MGIKDKMKSFNGRLILVGGVLFVLLILCLVLLISSKDKELDGSGEKGGSINGSDTVDNGVFEDEKQNEQLKKNIQANIIKYNDLVNEYNEKAGEYNDLIDSVISRVEINLPDKASLVSTISSDSITNYDEALDSKLTNDIETVSSDIIDFVSKQEELKCYVVEMLVNDYNLLADEYNKVVANTSVYYISGISDNCASKNAIEHSEIARSMDNNRFLAQVDSILNDMDVVIGDYYLINQITDPEPSWVKTRLKNIPDISGVQGVSKNNDPNGLLGKEGGYSGCLYFTVKGIEANVSGNTIVEKGTDAGGAVEIYHTVSDAENRCDYLGQFDNTLLYSGSYVIVGTMVVRTSYQFSDQEQIELTNKIIEELTRIDVS